MNSIIGGGYAEVFIGGFFKSSVPYRTTRTVHILCKYRAYYNTVGWGQLGDHVLLCKDFSGER